MSEFDKYTRDELIADIKAMRLRLAERAEKEIKLACSSAVKEFEDHVNKRFTASFPFIESEFEKVLYDYENWLRELSFKHYRIFSYRTRQDRSLFESYRTLKNFKELEISRFDGCEEVSKRIMLNNVKKVLDWFKGGS